MRHKRPLLALGAVLAAVSVCGGVVIWNAGRVLRSSARQVANGDRIPFVAATLDPQTPASFETLSAPAGFRDIAIFGSHIAIGGGGGLFEYDSNGTLLKRFRTGLELPAAPITALAVANGGQAELWLATSGEGALVYDGSRFRHIRSTLAPFRKLTSVLPLATGRVLFGTAKAGVLMFDGNQLAPLHPSLADAQVTALAGDETSLWIGTQNAGVMHWHAGQLDRVTEAEGLPDEHVFSITLEGDIAYASTALGIAEIRAERVQRVLAKGYTVQAALKHGAEILGGTLDEGLVRIQNEAKSRISAVRSAECDGCTIHRLIAADGEVLALTSDGLYRTGAQHGTWKPLISFKDLAQNGLTCGGQVPRVLSSDGAAAGGLCASEEARLADRNIAALAPDSSGRLWIGYFDRGLDILDPSGSRAQHVEDDVIFCVNRIVHDTARDRAAVATSNGLAMFTSSGLQRQVLTRADGLIASQVTDVLIEPDGSMIAGTPAGVSFVEPARISSIYAFHGLVNNHVYALARMGPRTLVGTLGGLSVIESGLASVSFTTSNSGFKHNWITAVLPTGNDLFIGTYGGGIMHLDPGGSWTTFADLPAHFEVNINAMCASDRAVYAGTLDRGLAVYSRAAGRWRWITRGLPSTNVTATAVRGGVVYLGTDNGLVRVTEDALL